MFCYTYICLSKWGKAFCEIEAVCAYTIDAINATANADAVLTYKIAISHVQYLLLVYNILFKDINLFIIYFS